MSLRLCIPTHAGSKGRFIISLLTYLDCGGRLIVSFIVGGLAARSAYLVICSQLKSCHPYGLSAWILTVGAVTLILSVVNFSSCLFCSSFLHLQPTPVVHVLRLSASD